MLRLYRIDPTPEHETLYAEAHGWMRAQPDLYSNVVGFDDVRDFIHHPGEQLDFALTQGGQLIALASLVYRGRRACEFELITPPRPRIRPILALLRQLQELYFGILGFALVFTKYPLERRFDRPCRLCRLFGWREPQPNYFEMHLIDYLNQHGQKALAQ